MTAKIISAVLDILLMVTVSGIFITYEYNKYS